MFLALVTLLFSLSAPGIAPFTGENMAAPPHTVTGDGGFNWKRGENNRAENANSPGGRQRQTRQWRSVRMP